jgi:hypothetical protein
MTRKSTKKNKEGRPTVMTQETIQKLEQAFAFGSTDEEACFYANIGKSTLYDYIKANPEFSERKEALKLNPILKARETVVSSLDNPIHAQWYLARKRKKEFSERQELTGSEGESIKIETTKQLLGDAVEVKDGNDK